MHPTRRSTGSSGLSTLSIVLPHPSLPRRRSSLLNLVPAPRTPLASPTCSSIFSHRKSSDSYNSWNSSSQDLADDLDFDWKPDQILFLRRTLDALPPHLVTPFNGPIPPSNLLDKIARGVAQAKGEDWPHSQRATRAKLIELARKMADEDSKLLHKSIPEEDTSNPAYTEGEVLQPTTNIGKVGLGAGLGPRRPLYRQSSMDFVTASDSVHDDSISRLSKRLQKTDRFIPNPNYHPYSRSQIHRRSSSPPRPNRVPSLINPSTPSSSTLSSLASLSATGHPRTLRRSMSITSSSTSSSRVSLGSAGNLPPIADDPRVTRIRRSESFCVLAQPDARRSVKRAPSYGAMAQESRLKASADMDVNASCPSSDEEEKVRTRLAKKPRVRNDSAAMPPMSPSPAPSTPTSSATRSPETTRLTIPKSPSVSGPGKRTKKTGANKAPESVDPPARKTLISSPSMFGAELLPLLPLQAAPMMTPVVSSAPLLAPPAPCAEKVKTLRRVRRLPAARRISFGSLVPPVGENVPMADVQYDQCIHPLGSAFQLR
ncbi:hypothetical protein MKEN_00371000 [Mycena kentingensis (nom. inval.)]|nr:hypothetical protein MKEN_00371000 [Mycena kentingensis (nom. inval.)]